MKGSNFHPWDVGFGLELFVFILHLNKNVVACSLFLANTPSAKLGSFKQAISIAFFTAQQLTFFESEQRPVYFAQL